VLLAPRDKHYARERMRNSVFDTKELSGRVAIMLTKDLISRYDDVMYWVEDPGDATADKKVSQRVDWCCGTRKRVV
jgi:hypothetical protein